MQETFTIVSKSPYLPEPWPRRSVGRNNPHHYLIENTNGDQCGLLSKRSNYQPGDTITLHLINDFQRGGGRRHYIDPLAPLKTLHLNKAAIPSGQIDSDVILEIDDIQTVGPDTTVTGRVFYFDPSLRNLTDTRLRDAFKAANAPISIETKMNPYYLNVGWSYTFPKLENVTVSGGVIKARYTP